MVKRVEQPCCLNCIHLQREDPIISGQMALYRCTSQKSYRNRVVGWVQKDKPQSGLRNQGGSCCNKLYPGDVILCHSRFGEVTAKWLYCGTVKDSRMKLMYNKNKMEYKVVSSDWLRNSFGKIRICINVMKQNDAQLEASKRMAKKRKAKWEEKNE